MIYSLTFFYIFFLALYIFFYIRALINYFHKKKEFVDYLFLVSDLDTLYELGVINRNGIKEGRRVLYTQVDEKLWGKYKQTNDKRYIEFDEIYMKYGKIKIIFFVLICITTIIFVIIKEIL
jgi:hypothetical protein